MAAVALVTAPLLAQTSPDEYLVHFYPDLFLLKDWASNKDELATAALDEYEDNDDPLQLDAPSHELAKHGYTTRTLLLHTLGLSDYPPPRAVTRLSAQRDSDPRR
jgi:hypothetical protein